MKKTLFAAALVVGLDANVAAACDQKAISKLQPKVTKSHSQCVMAQMKAQTRLEEANFVAAVYYSATPNDQKKLRKKLKKAQSRVRDAQKSAGKACGTLQKNSDKLVVLSAACAPALTPTGVTPPADFPTNPVSGSPIPDAAPPDSQPSSPTPTSPTEPSSPTTPTTPTDPGTTPTPSNPPPATNIDPTVAALVQNFQAKGYIVTLRGNPAALASTTFDVTISGERFLFYPNGVTWHPGQNLYVLRDYFQPSEFRALRLGSGLSQDFIRQAVIENIPAAVAERNGHSLVIFKLPSAPTQPFGVLRVPDGREFVVYPHEFNSVIYWLFPETYYLQLLQYQIISGMLTNQYRTALNVISNFPGSQTTFEYQY